MAKNFKNRHERMKKELEINKLFRLLGLKWLIVILITAISGFELYLGTIVVLIVIYDFYITIKKKAIIFKKIIDNEIKLLFLIFSIIIEYFVMLREIELYNEAKEL